MRHRRTGCLDSPCKWGYSVLYRNNEFGKGILLQWITCSLEYHAYSIWRLLRPVPGGQCPLSPELRGLRHWRSLEVKTCARSISGFRGSVTGKCTLCIKSIQDAKKTVFESESSRAAMTQHLEPQPSRCYQNSSMPSSKNSSWQSSSQLSHLPIDKSLIKTGRFVGNILLNYQQSTHRSRKYWQ